MDGRDVAGRTAIWCKPEQAGDFELALTAFGPEVRCERPTWQALEQAARGGAAWIVIADGMVEDGELLDLLSRLGGMERPPRAAFVSDPGRECPSAFYNDLIHRGRALFTANPAGEGDYDCFGQLALILAGRARRDLLAASIIEQAAEQPARAGVGHEEGTCREQGCTQKLPCSDHPLDASFAKKIGVIGGKRCDGCTHLSMAIARTLERLGHMTVLIVKDCDFEELARRFARADIDNENMTMDLGGLNIVAGNKWSDACRLPGRKAGSIDYVVVDYGVPVWCGRYRDAVKAKGESAVDVATGQGRSFFGCDLTILSSVLSPTTEWQAVRNLVNEPDAGFNLRRSTSLKYAVFGVHNELVEDGLNRELARKLGKEGYRIYPIPPVMSPIIMDLKHVPPVFADILSTVIRKADKDAIRRASEAGEALSEGEPRRWRGMRMGARR